MVKYKARAMWQIKTFKTRQALAAWIAKHDASYQWHEVFIENAYGVQCRKLRRIY